MRLNDALIASEKYRGEPTTDDEGRQQWPACILWDDEIQGFGVRIFPSQRGRPSRKDFLVTWKVGLRTRTMAIGTFPECSLRQARKMAREALDLARRGQDPIEARQRALGIGTTEDLASRFLFEHKAAQRKPSAPSGDSAAGSGATGAGPAETAPDAETAAPAASTDAAVESAPAADDAGATAAAAEPETEVSAPFAQPAPGPATEPVPPSLGEAPEVPPSFEPEVEASMPEAPVPTPEAPVAAPETAVATPVVPEPKPVPGATASPEPPRRQVAAPPTTSVKRGPTKVRLLPVPESLYRVIEHGARESSMTIASYLNALIEIARAAVGDAAGGRAGAEAAGTAPGERGPSVGELFSQVQEAQAVKVGDADEGDEPG